MRTRTPMTFFLLNGLAVVCATVRLPAEQPNALFAPPPQIAAIDNQPAGDVEPRLTRLPPVDMPDLGNMSSPLGLAQQTDGPEFAESPIQNSESDAGPTPSVEVIESRARDFPEAQIPPQFVPWWQPAVTTPLRQPQAEMAIDVNSLIVDALRYSARVRAISDNAIIAQTNITRADAEFDAHAFMESKFIRTSIPTGSVLEAGFNVPRLREEDWFYNAGYRRKNRIGGRFEIAQRIGLRDSNSQFFFPNNQGNSRLTLSYNQPLLNGAGRAYNNSLVMLANIDTGIAVNRTAAELQDHLLAVTEGMWELYLQRTLSLQKQRHLDRAEVILQRLDSRREIDSLESQIARARAAVSMRRAELIRAATAIRNAEARLRGLVNSPTMLANREAELIPIQPPVRGFVRVAMQNAVLTALENRPEINAVTQEIEAARVRMNVARNELMPVLDVVLETYVDGLRGDSNIRESFADQFSVGEPSYTAGLVFEVPIYQRAARANFQRRRVELRQLCSRLQESIETLHAEVEVAVREVETAYRELQAKYTSMDAAATDVDYLQRRWEELPGDDRAASFLLADLLDAQDRLVLEEFSFARTQIDYTLSFMRLNRATGTLLQHEQVELVTDCENCLPTVRFVKGGAVTEAETPSSHD